jgi:hypothetical protein
LQDAEDKEIQILMDNSKNATTVETGPDGIFCRMLGTVETVPAG